MTKVLYHEKYCKNKNGRRTAIWGQGDRSLRKSVSVPKKVRYSTSIAARVRHGITRYHMLGRVCLFSEVYRTKRVLDDVDHRAISLTRQPAGLLNTWLDIMRVVLYVPHICKRDGFRFFFFMYFGWIIN